MNYCRVAIAVKGRLTYCTLKQIRGLMLVEFVTDILQNGTPEPLHHKNRMDKIAEECARKVCAGKASANSYTYPVVVGIISKAILSATEQANIACNTNWIKSLGEHGIRFNTITVKWEHEATELVRKERDRFDNLLQKSPFNQIIEQQNIIYELQQQRDSLQAQLDAAKRDTERMTWLSLDHEWGNILRHHLPWHVSLRSAIDAAITNSTNKDTK